MRVRMLNRHVDDKTRYTSRRRFWSGELMERFVEPATVFLAVLDSAKLAVP